jgi:two-component system sensor histidine kinase DesK
MSLVLREAVTNVVRHAQASQCVMRFVAQNGKTSLVVEDNGRGGVREEGNGLRGMRERIEALGGRFAVDGTRGTRLTIEIPAKSIETGPHQFLTQTARQELAPSVAVQS